MALVGEVVYLDEHHIESKWVVYGVRLPGGVIRYVGLTTQGPVRRFYYNHLRSAYSDNAKSAFYDWMRKYDKTSFEVVVLSVCIEGDYDSLFNLEIYWIDHYRSTHGSLSDKKTENYLLNHMDGGQGVFLSGEDHWNYGKTRPQETKDKISQTRKKRKIGVWNAGLRLPQYDGPGNNFFGKNHTDETRLKMSKSSHKRWHTSTGKFKDTCNWCVSETT